MKQIFRWAMMAFTLVLLMALAVGGRPDHTTAAALLAGTPDTAATLEVTPEETAEVPAEPSADEMTLILTKAPPPDAGAIGIATEVEKKQVRIKAVVADGPADKAGLLPGDVVSAIDGKPITSSETLNAAIAPKKAGDTLTFTIEREGDEQKIPVIVAKRREVYCPLPAPTVTAGKTPRKTARRCQILGDRFGQQPLPPPEH
jgi:predicted metalloprotease with PDZ domain